MKIVLDKSKSNYSLQDVIVTISVFFYYVAIFLMYSRLGISLGHLPYQLASVFCVTEYVFLRVLHNNFKFNIKIIFFVFLCVFTGLLNLIFIQNISALNLIECAFFNTIIACLILERKIDTRWIGLACYFSVVMFALDFMQAGFGERIGKYSNNQISSVLLIIVVVYYALKDIYHERITILPAFLVWIMALLVRGRSGIITCTILFFIILREYFKGSKRINNNERTTLNTKNYTFLKNTLIVLSICFLIYILFNLYSDFILNKFLSRGLDDTGRFIMWKEYFDEMIRNPLFFLLGVPKQNLIIGLDFAGITHNSFISIHADNGIFMLLMCIVMLVSALRYAVVNKHYIYFFCSLIFCLRSSFDSVFWGSAGTTTFMVLLFLPLLCKHRETYNNEVRK